jgi:hypothetical protein
MIEEGRRPLPNEAGATAAGRQAARLLAGVAARVPDLQLEAGLTDDEAHAVEQEFGFAFAADHRAFLTTVLPVGPRWPDWRHGDPADLQSKLAWPVNGVLFDVEHAVCWFDGWGPRPESTVEAVAVARQRLSGVPQLVPVYGHRYLPSGRELAGHPVLSVYQTDIIYYGVNLVDYLHQEFRAGPGIPRSDPRWRPRATVPFWRDLVT